MKTSHIILIVIIALAIGIIISTSGDASKYVTFAEALELSSQGDNDKVHVVGKLNKNERGDVLGMFYNPILDPNRFEFSLVDNSEKSLTVIYLNAKPQDFDKSEQVVVVGNIQGDVFVASEILMKCPSKYEEKEVKEAGV